MLSMCYSNILSHGHFIICRKCGLNILAMFNLNTEKVHDAVTCHYIVKY